jgi:hypothetical protein
MSMTPAPTSTPTHRRSITIEGFDVEGGFDMIGTLTDERPWAEDHDAVPILHHMELRLHVDAESLSVTDADATMHDYPHAECPSIEPAFRSLIGLSVARGYMRAVQDRLGRERGCSHLEFLARAMGPATIQMISSSARRRGQTTLRTSGNRDNSWLANTCHLWSVGGIGMHKVDIGVQPGSDRYPVPSVIEIRRRRSN